MKKFFSLLMIFMLAISLAVPASAFEMDGHTLPDTLNQFGETVSIAEASEYMDFYVNTNTYDAMFSFIRGTYTLSNNTLHFTEYGDRVLWTYDRNNNVWNFVSDHTYYAGEEYVLLDGFAISSVSGCDGSSCSAADANTDGICDDCGKVLSLRAPSSYPELPTVDGNNLESVVLLRDDGYFYMALTSDTPYSVSGTVSDIYLITVADETEVSYTTYKCTDGMNWVHTNSGKAYSLSVGTSSDTLLASTFDWSKDGEHFFPVPPTLAEATEMALGEMTATLGGTMKVLVLCGVGLMASLVVLSLFGKRSLIFLR